MPTEPRRPLTFDTTAVTTQEALVLVFDLEGFTSFCGQPGAHAHVPALLNRVFGSMELVMDGSDLPWVPPSKRRVSDPIPLPDHQEFLGDGGLYLWLLSADRPFPESALISLMNRLWTLKRHFRDVMKAFGKDVPLPSLPTNLRFGLARGEVHVLPRSDGQGAEYTGYSMNLASRLQGYCRDLGFIASAGVGLPDHLVREHKYLRVVATQLRGLPREVVLVDGPEFERLKPAIRRSLFEAHRPAGRSAR